MIKTISLSDFRDAFRKMGRQDNFSHEGLEFLYDYLEETDPDYDLDVIQLCTEFAEGTEEEIRSDYNLDEDEDVERFLEHNTSIVGKTSDGYVYLQF